MRIVVWIKLGDLFTTQVKCQCDIMYNFRTMVTERTIDSITVAWISLAIKLQMVMLKDDFESSLVMVTHSVLRSNANVSSFALFTFGIALREFFRKCSDSLFVFWVPLNILCRFQFSCLAPPACRNVMHTVLSPIILSPPGHCCPIVNIRGHPPPARFPKQIFQLLQ